MNPPRPRLRLVTEFLGSMNLAISLLLTVAVASIIGTVVDETKTYAEHTGDYGPFWFEVFRVLGVYDVYSTGWFLAILAFLLVSTATCLVRNTPAMLRELRSWRANVTRKSVKYGRNRQSWNAASDPGDTVDTLRAGLARAGYGTRVDRGGDHILVTARRGRWNRFGYIFTHAAIVIIACGGLLDSQLGLKVAHLAGAIETETRNLRASQIPDASWLPEWNHAFSGNVTVPEGTATDVAFVNLYDGYLVQPLPFRLELEDFRVKRYPSGPPSEYESDVVVHDPALAEPFATTISVNNPLRHRGYSVYQADFSDGGSELELTALPLAPDREPYTFTGIVDERADFTVDERLRIEFDDFTPFNVNPVTGEDGARTTRNFGPSFDYTVRWRDGASREYRTYMLPVERDGREYFLSGMRTGPDEGFRYLYIPVDEAGRTDRFFALLERMDDAALVRATAQTAVADAVAGSELDTEDGRAGLIDTVERLVVRFRRAGFDGVLEHVEERVPAQRQEQVFQAYLRVLQSVMAGLYEDVLAVEGIDRAGDAEWAFFRDALTAINGIDPYGKDWLLRLDSFDHRQASGFQIARSPGQNIVYFGATLLIIGLFLMFYVDHRRLWFWLERESGGTGILMAGSSARGTLDFARDFDALAARLAQATGSDLRSKT